MPIIIIQPQAVAPPMIKDSDASSDSSSDNGGGADIDIDMTGMESHPQSGSGGAGIVTPGQIITTDSQWMRGHGTQLVNSSTIKATVAGTVSRTNKLLSVSAMRARYIPEVGDLVVGRIIEVQAKRWRVDVNAPQNAALPLSSINLPGGILRKRTETDELAIRNFFSEGDLLVAEVQGLLGDGGAMLHTRSLKFGKLRNGLFLAVKGQGGGHGGGVVKSRRQTWTIDSPEGGGKAIDVILGVNGYVWIQMHVHGEGVTAETKVGLNRLDEAAASAGNVYSSQNDRIDRETTREIARLRGVVTVLAEYGLRIDEEMVMRGYREAVELAKEMDAVEDIYLGGEKGDTLARILSGR
ncbi:uncharacterized protein MKZ38_005181 [Zalerion maritima]|uniref:Exosome complex component N-terminal domain-containing protein n=1 Tax=Zalerion maritima TaxID=339359 RepID=A0AAD5WUV7_9PEZI|nr:uncharacterized protein MKZ38_005181 [Zalerion maritima]